jgi:hypothetical protein
MKKINTFFQPVSAARKSANLQLEKISLDEKLEMEEKNRLAKDAILKASMEERIAESRKRRANVKEIDAHLSDHYHLLQDSIDALGDEDLHLSEDSPVLKKAKKTWNKRPDNRQFIATESMTYGTSSVIKSFKDEFEGLSASAAKQRVITWRNDLKIKKRTPDYRVRMPMYGSAVEEAVLRNANETRAAGLSLDGTILRRYLMVHLEKANLLGLLKENGGCILGCTLF